MLEDARSAMKSWKEAEAAARAAESQLRQAWAESVGRRRKSVPAQLAKSAAALRAQANDKLRLTLRLMNPERPNRGQP